QYAEWYHQHERYERELCGISERGHKERRDRRAIRVGLAHVADRKLRYPVAVLDPYRSVGADLMIQSVNRALIGERTKHRAHGMAGEHWRTRESDDAQQPQRNERKAETLQ